MCREERVACSNICWGQSSNTEGTPCTTSSNHKIMRDPPNAAPIIQIFKRTDGVWKPLHVMLSYLLLKAITILKSIMIRLIFRDWNITIKYGICRLLLVMSGLSVWRPFIESFQALRALGLALLGRDFRKGSAINDRASPQLMWYPWYPGKYMY